MDKEPRIDFSNYNRAMAWLLPVMKRTPWEQSIRDAYFTLKKAVKLTKRVPANEISRQMTAPSRVSPTMNIAELRANLIRREKGQPWLNGKTPAKKPKRKSKGTPPKSQLQAEGNAIVRASRKGGGVASVGWFEPIKKFSPLVTNKQGADNSVAAQEFGGSKGGGSVSGIGTSNPLISAWNSYKGSIKKWKGAPRRTTERLQRIILKGVQIALDAVAADNLRYARGQLDKIAKQFNRM